MANSCKQLTRRLEHRFFNKQTDEHQIDDEVLFCCWKLRDYSPIYEKNPFSTLSDDQRRKLEESVAMHFNPSLRTQSGMKWFLFPRCSRTCMKYICTVFSTGGGSSSTQSKDEIPMKRLTRREIKAKQRVQKTNRQRRLMNLKYRASKGFSLFAKRFPSIDSWQIQHRVHIVKLK